MSVDRLLPVADGLTHATGWWPGVYAALVTDVQDPLGQGRVKVKLPWCPDSGSGSFEVWARLATMMAGAKRGTWFVPDAEDEVVVAFEGGDPSAPIVIGSLWNGTDDPPEMMAAGNHKRTILTGAGVRITLDDTSGSVSMLLETPGGQRVLLEDSAAAVTVRDSNGNSIKLESAGITITASAQVSVKASTVQVDAGMVTVNAGMSKFSGVVQCDTLISNAVVSASYTPGAGNIW